MRTMMLLVSVATTTLCACVAATDGASQASTTATAHPVISVTSSHPQISTQIVSIDDGVRIDVHDEVGIGGIDIALDAEMAMPLTVRLHLRGLEALTLSVGAARVHTRGSQGGTVLTPSAHETLVVTAFRADGTPAESVPLQDGYFDVRLPEMPADGDAQAFSLNWIDFYR